MRINFDKLEPLPGLNVSQPEIKFPYFLPLTPYGLGMGDVESLSSYLCRQAEQVKELSHPYGRRLLDLYADPSLLPSCKKFPARGLHNCNGVGKLAERYISATNAASRGGVDAYYLSLKPLAALCDRNARGLQRQYLAWCDECWKEDVHDERIPYVRLYWLLQGTKICVIHNRRLSEYCPACGEIQFQYPFHPRQWLCGKCGFTLSRNEDESAIDNFTLEQAWGSHAIYCLIERVYSDRLIIEADCVSRSLRRVLITAKLTPVDFAARLNVSFKVVDTLLSGRAKPFFLALLDICYRMDIPIDQFLFDRDVLTSPDVWRNLAKPAFHASAHIAEKKRPQIRERLQHLLLENPTPPVRVSHLAAEFGISYTALAYNFRNEYRELRSRYLKWEQEQRSSSHADRLQNIIDAVFSLVRHGIYPSDRKLRDLKLVAPSDLRRDDVITILRAIQEVYCSLNIHTT